MKPLTSIGPALDVSAHVRRLPSGEYLGYIEYKVPAADTESFEAGVFGDRDTAQAEARRLMNTFIESVQPPCLMAA